MKEWFSSAEISGLPGLPRSARGINKMGERGELKRRKRAVGKGWEYHYTSLPVEAQAALAPQLLPEHDSEAACDPQGSTRVVPQATCSSEELWRWAESRPERQREQGRERAALLREVMALNRAGNTISEAFEAVARAHGRTPASLRNWYYGTRTAKSAKPGARHYHEADWPAALVPGWTGRTTTAECSEEAWDAFKALYLVRRAPTLNVCHERVAKIAAARGWTWPSISAVRRRVNREISRPVLVLARRGPEALDRLMPAMTRDRSAFRAMEAVNGDGIDWKRFCKWPDGEVARPCTWISQDLYSNKLLAWRTDRSENKEMFRLAYGDLIERWGIPPHYYIDNTMAAASKWMTGGIKNRYRFKIRDEDPIGIMPQMGTDVHFVKPSHGQSKPVERANRELRERIDSHPKFEGRGTMGRPIPIEDFLAVMDAEFAAYNAKLGRRTKVAAGRSFNESFAESYEHHPIKKPTAEQRRLWLCAAERIRCHKTNGSVALGRGPHGENRYWCEALAAYAGREVVIRFDPQQLHESVHAYTLDGRYIGEAACTWAAGFADAETAQTYHRERGRFKRATKKALEAEKRMQTAAAAALIPQPAPGADPESKVVELARPRQRAVGHDLDAPRPTRDAELEEHNENFDRYVQEAWRGKKSELL